MSKKDRSHGRGRLLLTVLCCLTVALVIFGHALAGSTTQDSTTDEINIGFRFSKDEYIIETYTEHGIIVPNGAVKVKAGENQTFAFTPDVSYQLSRVLVDGTAVWDRTTAKGEPPTGYAFRRVLKDYKLEVVFRPIPTASPSPTPSVTVPPTATPTTSPTVTPRPGGPGGPGTSPTATATPPREYDIPDDDIPQSGVGGASVGDCIE